ncbi:translation initiation factor IF-2 [Candidatus Parcubacteria bacterium]|nr:translation initiation factor IF-2 [Candidatus Parcubacteria bacterium]
MNITELARKLRITPQELREYLPQFGFDIGAKAIKINKSVAHKIIKDWPRLRRQIQMKKDDKRKEEEAEKRKNIVIKNIKIPNILTVRELSVISNQPVNIILAELMKNGIFASINEKIDYDTVWLISEELGLKVQKESKDGTEIVEDNKLQEILKKENKENLITRPPVIVVMGHVDHGKTSLLDAIRRSHKIDEEMGGITQHIGAYQVNRRGQDITFIDTPGHEAFTAMRSRGAKIADVAILIVAADDGVQPQTIEAYKIIQAAKLPFIVAINKIDKAEADVNKIKTELSNKLKITPEDWGGNVICSEISAKNETGIVELLDSILLVAEAEAETLKANPKASAVGTVIESHVNKESGPIATVLIQNGTLKTGDKLILNNIQIGKVKRLNNYYEKKIDKATPATPTQILGLKTTVNVGDIIEVGTGKKIKHPKRKNTVSNIFTTKIETVSEDPDVKKVNIIIKSDVLGTIEAIDESLEKINTKKVKAKIIHSGLGNITEGDVIKAETTKSKILGFNIKVSPQIKKLARDTGVTIKLYSIIYDLINDVKEDMQSLVVTEIKREKIGRLKVLEIFRTEKGKQIIGGKVLDGFVENNVTIEIIREKTFFAEGKLTALKIGTDDVKKAEQDEECGIFYEGKHLIEKGDILEFYKETKVVNKL